MRGTPRVGSRRRRRSGRSSSLRQSQHRGRNDMGWPRGRRARPSAPRQGGTCRHSPSARVPRLLQPRKPCSCAGSADSSDVFTNQVLATNFKGEQYNNRSLEGGAHF